MDNIYKDLGSYFNPNNKYKTELKCIADIFDTLLEYDIEGLSQNSYEKLKRNANRLRQISSRI